MPRPCRAATNEILWASAYPLLDAAGFQYRGRLWHRRRYGELLLSIARSAQGHVAAFAACLGLPLRLVQCAP